MGNVRVCEKCQLEKPIDAFPTIPSIGRSLWCSQCIAKYNLGKEPIREVDSVQLTREERRKDYHYEYYREHREEILARSKEYNRMRRLQENNGMPRPVGRPKRGTVAAKKPRPERVRERVIRDIGGKTCDKCGEFKPNDEVASFNAGDGKKEVWCYDCINKEPTFQTIAGHK
jgi:hypothetical protein